MVFAVVFPLWTWATSQSLGLFPLGKVANDVFRYPWSISLYFQEMFNFLLHEFSLRTGQRIFCREFRLAFFCHHLAQRFGLLFNTFEFCFVYSVGKAVPWGDLQRGGRGIFCKCRVTGQGAVLLNWNRWGPH